MSADDFAISCPLPAGDGELIQLAHGGGGRAMARLLDTVIRAAFDEPMLERRHDGAVLDVGQPIAFTTDSYVVKPLIFPGGDIGTLAVNGTVNDLAMCGARPLYLSVGFLLEEGLPIATLQRIAMSMREAAKAAGVRLITGDTKVVERGKADGMFINTAGIGRVVAPEAIEPASVRAGDVVILSGDIGRHGIAVMAAREGLAFETAIESDCAPLAAPVLALIEAGIVVHCLRDLTRGGLASALVEIAEVARLAVFLDEQSIPVGAEVTAACELLGLDPLHVANEGRFVAFVAPEDAEHAVALLHRHAVTSTAAIIGTVAHKPPGQVSCRGPFGVERIIDMLNGEQLPRIC
ncbi:MAG: hydrogenase expression/formation protein HypE [Acetobacteraceae bacterium]|nr:hydrogenase expression/formation protein HypE [Acetobacteraceae bacterium]